MLYTIVLSTAVGHRPALPASATVTQQLRRFWLKVGRTRVTCAPCRLKHSEWFDALACPASMDDSSDSESELEPQEVPRQFTLRRTPRAPWQLQDFAGVSHELYTMAAMARALTLTLVCAPRGSTSEVHALSCTCTRWQMALCLAIQRLLA